MEPPFLLSDPGVEQVSRDATTVDLSVGQPEAALLPTALVAEHVAEALARYGPAALAYGANAGPWPARVALAEWSGSTEGTSFAPDQILVTAGATHGLALLCRHLGRPGDCVLVQRTSYHLALDLFRWHGLCPVPVGRDATVPTGPELADVVASARGRGRRVAFAYVVPTFHNPTGGTWARAQRAELLDTAQRAGVTVVEDDPYRELYFGTPPPPSLAALSGGRGVVGVRTLSKVLAPGVRVGWMVAGADLVARLAGEPLFESGGGIAHLPALAAASLVPSEPFAAHVGELRRAYRRRRDAVVAALAPARRCGVSWQEPAGGFFVWLRLPASLPAEELVARATAERVPVLDGARCHSGAPARGEQSVRVSFSMYPPVTLAAAAARLAGATERSVL